MNITVEKSIFEITKLRNYFEEIKTKNIHEKSALDLGCGIPTNLFNLEIVFGFNNLIGVDLLSEDEAIKRGVTFQGASNYKGNKSYFECYRQHLKILTNDRIITSISHNRRLTNYKNHFSFEKTSIQEFEFEKITKMNILMAMNSLDFIPKNEAKKVIQKACSKIKLGGLFITELKHSENGNVLNSLNTSKVGDNTYINHNTNEKLFLYETRELIEVENLIEEFGFIKFIETQLYKNKNSNTMKSALIVMQKSNTASNTVH